MIMDPIIELIQMVVQAARFLGDHADETWDILVAHHRLNALAGLLTAAILLVPSWAMVVFSVRRQIAMEDKYDHPLWALGAAIGVLAVLTCVAQLTHGWQGLVLPEYNALREVLALVGAQ